MRHLMTPLKALVAGAAIAVLAACSTTDEPNIVEKAKADPQFSILVEAVVAADLAGTLSGPGPFTVFAPTNDAFAALLAELGVTKDQLLADKDLLTAVLTYHVLPKSAAKSQIAPGAPQTTVQGGIFKIGRAHV